MLVLSRSRGESVTIDGGIVVKVLRTSSGEVKLGFDAPKHIGIRRSECDEWRPQGADACCDQELEDVEFVDHLPNGKSAKELVESPAA